MPDMWMDVDAALAEVPVNMLPLIDDTDFKAIEAAIAYNAAGMALYWHFCTTAGAYTVTAVTPTTGGNYDWTDQGDAGIYTIEIPASGGASINNDTEGFGWFTGVCTGVLPWRGPVIGFRAAGLNNALIDDAYSATRGLSGTALPAAAADAAGGLPISDAGGLDIDAKLANTNEITAARMSELDAGTGGKMASEVDLIKTDAAAILADWVNGGRLDLLVDAIIAELAKVPKSDSNVSWNATALAAINAEMVDALVTDTIAEMAQGAPPVAPSISLAISYLYRKWRNKNETTATENKVYDDAGTTVLFKETHSDNGTTFTKGEYGTGA